MSAWLAALAELDPGQREQAGLEADPVGYAVSQKWLPPVRALEQGAEHFQVPFVELAYYQPDPAVLGLLAEDDLRRLGVMPLFRIQQQLYVAISRPEDLSIQDQVARLSGLMFEPVLCLHRDIEDALNRCLLTAENSGRALAAISSKVNMGETEEQKVVEDREAPTVRLVDHIIAQAIRLGASDIHLEPGCESVSLRYRIDGVLQEFPGPSPGVYPAVVSRIKISSGMDIAERRLPQDGRSQLTVDAKKYDLRVSIIPQIDGEGIVIRILNPYAIKLDLRSMGFEPDLLERYFQVLSKPNGLTLVTGPTGSGKSTTLYASLAKLNDKKRKIITLEDPVEYRLPGITQIAVNPEIGYTFGSGLRAILRHDPDTVLVGEIRDRDSAEIAMRAALTGHQLFSTLHTNDAPGAVTRLVDMGVPRYQVLSALRGVLSQRLVRRLCEVCKQPAQALGEAGLTLASGHSAFRAVGCAECNGLGYRGRVAVHEFLEITPAVRQLEYESASTQQITLASQSEGGYFPLKRSLEAKIGAGLTSFHEALALLEEQ